MEEMVFLLQNMKKIYILSIFAIGFGLCVAMPSLAEENETVIGGDVIIDTENATIVEDEVVILGNTNEGTPEIFDKEAEAVVVAVADEDTEDEDVEEDATDEEDSDESTPTLLPDSPFYFLKDWWRAIKVGVTFNNLKKAELRLQYANERLLEAQALAEEEGDEDKSELLADIVEKYQGELEKIQARIEELTTASGVDSEDTGKFAEKFIAYKLRHESILEKLEGKVSEENFERMEQARNRAIENFGSVMEKVQNKEQFRQRLENVTDDEEDTPKQIENQIRALERIREHVPEEIKEQIEERTEERIEMFKERFNREPNGKRSGRN